MAYIPSNPNGQATSANSSPVVIASDQNAVPVSDNNSTLSVDDGGGTLTVDGTVNAAQSGTWDINNVSGTVSLPTGAATSAKQPSLGTAGTASSDVITVQGIASMTALKVDGSAVTQPISGTVTANAGTGNFTVVQSTAANLNATVTGTVNAAQSGTWNITNVSGTVSLPTGASTSANQSTIITSVQLLDDVVATDGSAALTKLYQVGGTDGTNAQILSTNVSGHLNIADGGNSITVDGTITASNTAGDVAHDGADSGNPVKIGFQAETSLSGAVANGDRANGVSDVFGRQLVSHIDQAMQVWKSANYTSAQTGASIWTPAAGKKIAITYLSVASYGTTAGRVILWFGASGDTTYSAGTDQLVWAGSFAPSTSSKPGMLLTFPFCISAATADHQLRITSDAAVSLDVTVYGYEI